MATITGSFEFEGAKVTVQKPNGFTQAQFHRLQRLLANHGADGMDFDNCISMLFLLANTVSTEGLTFPVPVKNTTHPEMLAFIRGIGEADPNLFRLWDGAISEIMHSSNDPDLLPPEELSQKKETIPESG